MSQLPARPDLDQLHRQARELHRAALAGDADALRGLRQVSDTVGLSAAQLAIAREYGFASWPKLKVEVERRRAQAVTGVGKNEDPAREDHTDEESATVAEPGPAAAPPLKSWKEMREWAASLLLTRTGQDVAAWNRRVAAAGLGDEQALRAWLDSQGVTGYGQARSGPLPPLPERENVGMTPKACMRAGTRRAKGEHAQPGCRSAGSARRKCDVALSIRGLVLLVTVGLDGVVLVNEADGHAFDGGT